MKSPEGQDLENSIGSCFSDVIVSLYSVSTGICYIMYWTLTRYAEGVTAGRISTDTVNAINFELGLRNYRHLYVFNIK